MWGLLRLSLVFWLGAVANIMAFFITVITNNFVKVMVMSLFYAFKEKV